MNFQILTTRFLDTVPILSSCQHKTATFAVFLLHHPHFMEGYWCKSKFWKDSIVSGHQVIFANIEPLRIFSIVLWTLYNFNVSDLSRASSLGELQWEPIPRHSPSSGWLTCDLHVTPSCLCAQRSRFHTDPSHTGFGLKTWPKLHWQIPSRKEAWR